MAALDEVLPNVSSEFETLFNQTNAFNAFTDTQNCQWLNGGKVAKFCGFKAPTKVIQRKVSANNKTKWGELKQTINNIPYGFYCPNDTMFINEAGFYELVQKSNKKFAAKFNQYVANTLLPTVRQNYTDAQFPDICDEINIETLSINSNGINQNSAEKDPEQHTKIVSIFSAYARQEANIYYNYDIHKNKVELTVVWGKMKPFICSAFRITKSSYRSTEWKKVFKPYFENAKMLTVRFRK